ncbi:saccharopine dehydrogenase family protein [Nocardia sp. NPDC057227]|uniref:saccharopine dehydrogenase family protein n=1 Tax=Nocardia sp. NPDC057227 TaxID=3346056 RepID=UPI00363D4B87
MPEPRELDLVLFGATGFVGKIIAEYLTGAAPAGARIGLAGRTRAKLEQVRSGLGPVAAEWELIEADVNDPSTLNAMVARTTAVLTTVGPYLRYGMPLVAACAHAGTHYADLTGEVPFVREAIDRYQDVAVGSGAKIVNSCGYDSVPSDLSVYQLYKRTLADNTGELTDVTLIAAVKGGVSGGTVDSLRAMVEEAATDPAKARLLTHPYALSPDTEREPKVGRQTDQTLQRASSIHPGLPGWVGTFVMAAHNTKIVRRSNGLLGWVYGKNFKYREVMTAGRSPLAPVAAAALAGGTAAGVATTAVLSRFAIGRKVLDTVLPAPGTGPSEKTRVNGWFRMKTYANTTSGTTYLATFAGKGDPGYQATAVMFAEAGLALAFDREKQSELTGILTPAAAIGDALTDRLRDAGMTIEVEPVR